MRPYILIISCLFISLNLSAQILNVEQQRIVTDTTGWAGRINLSISASKFTKSLFAFNGLSHLQYKTKKDLYLIVLNYDIVNAGGENFDNRGYCHFRYNRKINELIRWELFTQVQFNSLTKINQRWLTGIGPRLKLSEYEKAKFYFGIAYMYEFEELKEPKIFHRDHRLSSYFTFTLLPETQVKLVNTTYIQPLIRDFTDFRVSNDTALSFRISKSLRFTTSLSFLYDENPPLEVPQLNYLLKNGIEYKIASKK